MKKQKKRRGNSRYYFFLFIIIGTLLLSFLGIKEILGKMDFFKIESIAIKGNINLNEIFLRELSSEFIGMNLFSIKKKKIEKKYENIVRIKNIKVKLRIPNQLLIQFEERIASYYLKTKEGDFIPIDNEGYILDNEGFYVSEDVPLIDINFQSKNLEIGEKLENEFVSKVFSLHQQIQEINPELSKNISEYYLSDNEIYFVEMNSGCRIVLGDENLKDKIIRLKFLNDNQGFQNIAVLDLRFKNQIISRQR